MRIQQNVCLVQRERPQHHLPDFPKHSILKVPHLVVDLALARR